MRELTLQQLIDFDDAPVFEAIAYAAIFTALRATPTKDVLVLGYGHLLLARFAVFIHTERDAMSSVAERLRDTVATAEVAGGLLQLGRLSSWIAVL